MSLTIQSAPKEAVDQAVPLILSSGPELFTYMFNRGGLSVEDYLRACYLEGDGFFGYKNHTAVMEDGDLVGIGAFYSGQNYNRLSLQATRQTLQQYPLRCLPGMLRDFGHVKKVMRPPPRKMMYVANLGVSPKMQNRGVGSMLVQHKMHEAREQGYEIYALDVADTNPRAQALYTRLGFAVKYEQAFTGPDRGIAVPNCRRMVMSL